MASRPIVLITGSSGFLGRAIAKRLARHHRVVGLDSDEPKQPLHGVETVRVDLTSDDSVGAVLDQVRTRFGSRIASVVHLAAYYDLSGEPDPKYQSVTVEGTRRVLRGLRQRFDGTALLSFGFSKQRVERFGGAS